MPSAPLLSSSVCAEIPKNGPLQEGCTRNASGPMAARVVAIPRDTPQKKPDLYMFSGRFMLTARTVLLCFT